MELSEWEQHRIYERGFKHGVWSLCGGIFIAMIILIGYVVYGIPVLVWLRGGVPF